MATRIRIWWPIVAPDVGDLLADVRQQLGVAARGGAVEAGRAAVGPEDVAQGLGPLAGRHARLGGVDRRRHQVHGFVAGGFGERGQGGLDGAGVAARLPFLERLDPLPLDLGVRGEDAAVVADGERASPRSRCRSSGRSP